MHSVRPALSNLWLLLVIIIVIVVIVSVDYWNNSTTQQFAGIYHSLERYVYMPPYYNVLNMMTTSSLLIKCVFVQKQGRIPVKWTAIEAMTGAMKYSTKSDVYVDLT